MKRNGCNETKLNTQMFDSITFKYDFLNHIISFGVDKRRRKRAIQNLIITNNMDVLDLCCGTRELTLLLAQKIKGYGF